MKVPAALIVAAALAPPTAAAASPPASPAGGNAKYASAAADAMETIASLRSSSRGKRKKQQAGGDDGGRRYPDLPSESALFDRETRAVYWQGGRGRYDASALASSLAGPLLSRSGAGRHVRAAVLTAALWLWVWGNVSRYLAGRYFEREDGLQGHQALFAMAFPSDLRNPIAGWIATSVVRPALQFALLLVHALLHVRLPPYSPAVLAAVVALYLLESFTCSTRRYLSHSLDAPGGLREYLEGLRRSPPIVKWTVRCFHYEERPALRPLGRLLGTKDGGNPPPWLARKVVTHEAETRYNATSWDDRTTASVWRRAPAPPSDGGDGPAPFGKITLSKLLVLRDRAAREDYFAQQARFVTVEGRRDVHAEFGTEIDVDGFRPKVLAVRAGGAGGRGRGVVASSAKFRRRAYALCALAGLSLPYRIWLAGRCDELRVSLVKETSREAVRADGAPDGGEVGGDGGGVPSPPPPPSSSSWFRGRRSAADPAEEGRRARELFVRTMEDHSLYPPPGSSGDDATASAPGGPDEEAR